MAAERGYDAVLPTLTPAAPKAGVKVAIVGGGPTGMAAAHLLAREGVAVTLFEKEAQLGGIVRQVIPAFRISDEAMDKDAAMLYKLGVDVRLNTEAPSVPDLKAQGYTHILLAVGAWKPGRLDIPGNVQPVIVWLKAIKGLSGLELGHVAVVGGGNTAMDAARAALRAGAKSSTIVYRRTRKYMPADAEELELAMDDGVAFLELAAPVKQENGKLLCKKMVLGEPDATGRRRPVETDETVEIDCDVVISRRRREGGPRRLRGRRCAAGRQGPAGSQDQCGGRLCRRRLLPRSRHGGRGHCRRHGLCRGRLGRSPRGLHPRRGPRHPRGGHRPQGRAVPLRQVRGRPLPELQRGLPVLRGRLPQPGQTSPSHCPTDGIRSST